MLFKIFIATCLFSFLLSLVTVSYCEEVAKEDFSFKNFIDYAFWLLGSGNVKSSKTWYRIILVSEILAIVFCLHIVVLFLLFWK